MCFSAKDKVCTSLKVAECKPKLRNTVTTMQVLSFIFILCLCPFSVDDFTPGPYEVTFPANQTSQVLNIPITNDELLEADTNDFNILIVNFTSNCSIRSRSPNEVLVQILDEDSKLSGPVDGTHGSGYMNCIVLFA